MARTPKTFNGSASRSGSAFAKALRSIHRRDGGQLSQNSEVHRRKTRIAAKRFIKGNVVVRCSPSMTSDLFSSIRDEQHMKLIGDMGFGGLLSMKIQKTNKHFGAWVLSKYDPISSTIRWGKRNQLKLRNKDVNLAMGIPWEGKDIVLAAPKELNTMKKYICAIFGKEKFEEINIPFLSTILYKSPDGPMSKDEVVKFKTAFIMYIVTKFLAPVSLNNHISARYIKALVDIEKVQNYNWAKFVIDEVKNAAEVLQGKLSKGLPVGYINGCIILLQVFYLDNLENGINTIRHDRFPRISSYDDTLLSNFIENDMVMQNRLPFPSFGKLKLRAQHKVCYTARDNESQAFVQDGSIIKAAPQSIHDIDPPSFELGLSQLGDDNTYREMSPEYQIPGNLKDQFDEAAQLEVIPNTPPSRLGQFQVVVQEGTAVKSAPQSIHGIDQPCFEFGLSQLGVDNTYREMSPEYQIAGNQKDLFDEDAQLEVISGTKNNPINIATPNTILKEVSGYRVEMRESFAGIQIPAKAKKKIFGQPSNLLVDLPARTIKPSMVVKSPFLSKQPISFRNVSRALEDLYQYTSTILDGDSLQKIWVHLSNPVPMKLHLHNIQEALKIGRNMHHDTFNVSVHVLHEEEMHTFGSTEFIGWRHFLDQDFAMYALADTSTFNPSDHLHLFTDDSFPYYVLSCRLVFIPVLLVEHYSLYVFDLENKEVTILDPVRDISMGWKDIEQRHAKTRIQVSEALHECFLQVFPHWSDDIPDWEFKPPTTIFPECSAADSAYHVLHYMRNWDGTQLVNPVTMESATLRKEFLMNLLSFRSNEAILPEAVQSIIKGGSRR